MLGGSGMKRMLTGVLVGLALAMLPVGASASQTINVTLNGVETGVPPPCLGGSTSPFAGTARGDLQGAWWATICHTPLGLSAEILSGSFRLQTLSRSLVGSFVRGSVTFMNEQDFAGACRQHYAVLGQLTNGLFNATLTHYGAYYGGSCHVFSASVSGYASLHV
jgi:hypothetical protein